MSLDLSGTQHGQLIVLTRHSAENRKVKWNVQCLLCSKKYVTATHTIKKNIGGCAQCARTNTPKGTESGQWRGGRFISSVFLSNVKRGARRRGIEATVTIEELDSIWEQQGGKCVYTGRELKLSGSDITASLDRINSSAGYHKENVQFTHKTVNSIKWALAEDDFLQVVKEIYEHRLTNLKNGNDEILRDEQ